MSKDDDDTSDIATSVHDSDKDVFGSRPDSDSSEEDGELMLKAANKYAEDQFQELVSQVLQGTHITGRHY